MPKWILKSEIKKILDARLMSKEEREAFREKEKAQSAKAQPKDGRPKRKYLIEQAAAAAGRPGPKPNKTKQK